LVRYSASGEYLGQFPTTSQYGSEEYNSLTRGPDGNLYVLGNIIGQGYVQRVEMTKRAWETVYINQGQPETRQLTAPSGIAFDPSGQLYVGSNAFAGFGQTAVYRVDPPGLAPVLSYAQTDHLGDIEFDVAGNLFVGISGEGIRRYALANGAAFTIPTSSTYDFNFGPDGMLYVATHSAGVQKFDPSTGASLGTFVAAGSQGLGDVSDLVFGDDGILYVDDRGTGRILKYDAITGAPAGVFSDYSTSGQPVYSIAYAVPEPTVAGVLMAGLGWGVAGNRLRRKRSVASGHVSARS
jgi:streptogramin lyase